METEYRLIRHATLQLKFNGLNILVDPMLSPKNAMDPVANAANNSRIPMVELPVSNKELNEIIKNTDLVIVTHIHRDHWDDAAKAMLNKNIALICQPADADKIRDAGFTNVIPVDNHLLYKGIAIYRTSGHHGTGEIEEKMGTVSGFVLKTESKSVYIAGDTIWCDEVKEALLNHQPDLTILNAGAPRYLTGDPITMTADDVIAASRTLPDKKFVAVHMETVNHCTLNRAGLKSAITMAAINNVKIPPDGGHF